jgi:predicted MFS family arabinose efflux permease
MTISRKTWRNITGLTIIRVVNNTGFRMIFPFQPIFMKGFGISLGQITRMIAGQSLVGIFSPLIASIADTRGRKTGMLLGLIFFCLGCFIVLLLPTISGFFLFLILSILGKMVFEPSLQAYLGDIIPYQKRGFVLAITEMNWSMAFFLGVPAVGFLMNQFGLFSPFMVLAVLSVISISVVLIVIPSNPSPSQTRNSTLKYFSLVFQSQAALAGLSVMLLLTFANQVVNVVFGVWLNDSYGLQIAALGGASAVIGIAELIGEGGVSILSDRISKKKAVLGGIIGSVISSSLLPFLGGTVWSAFIGLFLFYLTFEFTIVSGIPMMSGVLPEARATVMALNIASISLGRGLGSFIAAPLYAVGFWINALVAALLFLLAIISLRYVVIKEEGII